MPEAEEADGRAFWAAALANPLPALGVCREVRPTLLQVSGHNVVSSHSVVSSRLPGVSSQ